MKKTRKKLLIAFLILALIIAHIYVCAIDAIPKSAIIFKGETLNIKTIFGIDLVSKNNQYEAILTSTTAENELQNQDIGTTNFDVKLFNTFTVKNVSVSVIERTSIIPIGQVAGLKLYTTGALVVGMSEIKGIDNKKYKPYDNTGMQEGDMITKINENTINNTNELIETVNKSEGKELQITYVRDDETLTCNITPVKISEDEYKLGLWVRDSAAGIGTMTYYDPTSKKFAALGHGITDIDTGELINVGNGEFVTTKVLSIVKGVAGEPGKIQGTIDSQKIVGTIYKNSNLGVYGILNDLSAINIDISKKVPVAARDEIELGKAKILCSLDGNTAKEYEIEIEKIYINNNYDNKSMLIRVTDENLINQTGGIIQGMSGCPVIQNGKFIGAITNVLVNEPTQGYAVFGDIMLKEMN